MVFRKTTTGERANREKGNGGARGRKRVFNEGKGRGSRRCGAGEEEGAHRGSRLCAEGQLLKACEIGGSGKPWTATVRRDAGRRQRKEAKGGEKEGGTASSRNGQDHEVVFASTDIQYKMKPED
ncbi:hypothetical protein HNY73_018833 [Argiope bruennichi]|uniref:Uncharacterized protein n=1 Tax=Argiope bruennichi TaxID=94029 RepID=A0A8T0EJ86_ARGBR|nr:hypothetical protein HNY73_018833 [Argiope bruennichi]